MNEPLNTTLSRPLGAAVVLDVQGEIDMATVSEFETAVAELLAATEGAVVIDLTGVSFLSSSGLAVLITTAQRVEERGSRLRLVVTTQRVSRLLEMTATSALFELYHDRQTAYTST